MTAALWATVVPRIVPRSARRVAAFRPRFALASGAVATSVAIVLVSPNALPDIASLDAPMIRTLGWVLVAFLLFGAGLGVAPWLKERPVAATVIAAACVLVGMWLERWNIIVPTLTRPRLVEYNIYQPTLTELSLTAASVALFMLLFLIFFKLFPAVSIWEIAEGRVIEEAQADVHIAAPQPTPRRRIGFFSRFSRGE
jgi:hypothetical protein